MGLFYGNPGAIYHLRAIGREVTEEINAVKRELDILEKAGFLTKERRQNRVLYQVDTKYPLWDDFFRIFAKQTPLVQKVQQSISRLGKVKFVAMSYAYAQKAEIAESEIYLLFVGLIVSPEVVSIVKEEEHAFPYEVNYTVMTEEEFAFRKKNNDPFIWSFLHKPKIMIIGAEGDLMA